MRTRNFSHLRSHLAVFEPGYPIQKGYIAQLLLYRTVPAVLREMQMIVNIAEPDKRVHIGTLSSNLRQFIKVFNEKKRRLTKEWPSLIRLFLEKFPVTFKSLPDSSPNHGIHPFGPSDMLLQPDTPECPVTFRGFPLPFASTEAVHASDLSASNLPEQTSAPAILKTLIHPDSPEDSMLLQSVETFAPVNSPSVSQSCFSQSPEELTDCASYVPANMGLEIKELYRQLSVKRLNEQVKRKDQSLALWRDKYKTLRNQWVETVKALEKSSKLAKDLEEKLGTTQKENKDMKAEIEHLTGNLLESEDTCADLKRRFKSFKTRASLKAQSVKQLHEMQLNKCRKDIR